MRLFAFLLLFLFSTISYGEDSFLKDHYTVQVYSSKSMAESKEFSYKFLDIGRPFLWPTKIKKETWFRVYVGLYSSKEEAEEVQKKVKDEFGISDAIIQKLINSD